MKANQLLKSLIAICDADPTRLESEVVIREPDKEFLAIAKVQWQADAEEIQILTSGL